MPYDAEKSGDVKKVTEKLKKTYANVSDTAARQAIAVFNSVMDSTGDEGKAWASVYSKMNERGLSKKAGVKQDILGASYYELHMGNIKLEVVPLTYSDDDWEYTKDGGVRIEVSGSKYALLTKQGFAHLLNEWGDAAALVKKVHSDAGAQGLAKNADVRFVTYDDPSYEVDVAGVELEFSPMRGGRGVRIDMGKHGEGGYVVLDPQQFANLAAELRQALAFVEGQSRTASFRDTAQRVAFQYAASRKSR